MDLVVLSIWAPGLHLALTNWLFVPPVVPSLTLTTRSACSSIIPPMASYKAHSRPRKRGSVSLMESTSNGWWWGRLYSGLDAAWTLGKLGFTWGVELKDKLSMSLLMPLYFMMGMKPLEIHQIVISASCTTDCLSLFQVYAIVPGKDFSPDPCHHCHPEDHGWWSLRETVAWSYTYKMGETPQWL